MDQGQVRGCDHAGSSARGCMEQEGVWRRTGMALAAVSGAMALAMLIRAHWPVPDPR